MHRRSLAPVALLLALAGCSATEYSAVSLYAICAPPAPDATTGACLYPATCANTLVGSARLDATTAQLDFRLPIQLNNLLANNADTTTGRINTNDAFVTSLEMTYNGTPFSSWSVAQAITVPAAGNTVGLLPLIPVQYFPAIAPPGNSTLNILVNVRAHGVLASQTPFTTAWYQVPVQVCSGCLAGSFCATGAIMVSCPSALPGQTSPGQTASIACIALTP
ncbi:MAG: hypothetical protein WCK73_08160 [Deltaproteobacteria bacterium]